MIQDYVVQPYYNKGAIFYAKTSVFLMWFIYIYSKYIYLIYIWTDNTTKMIDNDS